MNTVQLYDFETKTLTDIPVSELAPGYVSATVLGVKGKVYVNASQAKPATDTRQPPFTDPDTLAKFERFSKTFKDVYRKTPQEWADGFRYDTTPTREIAWWDRAATAFEHFTLGKNLSLLHQRDYFQLVCSCFNNGSRHALQTVTLTRLSRARARGVIAELARTWGHPVHCLHGKFPTQTDPRRNHGGGAKGPGARMETGAKADPRNLQSHFQLLRGRPDGQPWRQGERLCGSL